MSRDSWCTPRWLADAIGEVDLDPCSNERSHVRAMIKLHGKSTADDGLILASAIPANARVFLNPPYSRGQVIRWVQAYQHTDFMFLLRFDPSTEWFAALMDLRPFIWLPKERINFEPPPGVDASSNPFPHAIFSRSRFPSDQGVAYAPGV